MVLVSLILMLMIFLYTIKRALDFYYNRKPLWNKLFKNTFRVNYSWEKSADEYIALYEGLRNQLV